MQSKVVILNIDGAARSNPGPAGYGISAKLKNGTVLAQAYGYIGNQTNNFAEYVALLAALQLASQNKWPEITVKSDSQLMVRQINGQYKVKNKALQKLHHRAKVLISRFNYFSLIHVPREQNKAADKLANKALNLKSSDPKQINPIMIKHEQ